MRSVVRAGLRVQMATICREILPVVDVCHRRDTHTDARARTYICVQRCQREVVIASGWIQGVLKTRPADLSLILAPPLHCIEAPKDRRFPRMLPRIVSKVRAFKCTWIRWDRRNCTFNWNLSKFRLYGILTEILNNLYQDHTTRFLEILSKWEPEW